MGCAARGLKAFTLRQGLRSGCLTCSRHVASHSCCQALVCSCRARRPPPPQGVAAQVKERPSWVGFLRAARCWASRPGTQAGPGTVCRLLLLLPTLDCVCSVCVCPATLCSTRNTHGVIQTDTGLCLQSFRRLSPQASLAGHMQCRLLRWLVPQRCECGPPGLWMSVRHACFYMSSDARQACWLSCSVVVAVGALSTSRAGPDFSQS